MRNAFRDDGLFRRDWWGRYLPVNIGQYNFDEIRYLGFRDDVTEFEAIKAGEVDLREELSSRKWAKEYDFPAVRDGLVKKLPITTKTVAQLQGFGLNLRRARFAEARGRRALAGPRDCAARIAPREPRNERELPRNRALPPGFRSVRGAGRLHRGGGSGT